MGEMILDELLLLKIEELNRKIIELEDRVDYLEFEILKIKKQTT